MCTRACDLTRARVRMLEELFMNKTSKINTTFNVPNRTYFYGNHTKLSNVVACPDSFSAYQQRRKDVFLRLHSQHKATLQQNGYSLFYTFTYSELRIPKFLGVNVHDYNDIRWLFVSSGFINCLLRNFNTRLKYCLTSEFGEGKGKRGWHNNPHYHCILFLTPVDPSQPIISPLNFRTLIKSYWQGVKQSVLDKAKVEKRGILYHERIQPDNIEWDKEKMCKGYAQEGDKLGVVNSVNGLAYVVKYVTKDSSTRDVESAIPYAINEYLRYGVKDSQFMNDAIDNFVCCMSDDFSIPKEEYLLYGADVIYVHQKEWNKFFKEYKSLLYAKYMREYNVRHKVRFRASQGLGYDVFTSADFDKENATINTFRRDSQGNFIPFKEKICGQLYRQWFYKVEKHKVWSNTQNKEIIENFYRPNGNLIDYKLRHYDDTLSKVNQMFTDTWNDMCIKENFLKFGKCFWSDYICACKNEIEFNNLILKQYDRLILSICRCDREIGRCELVRRLSLFSVVYNSRTYDRDFECQINGRNDYCRFLLEAFYAPFHKERYLDYINNKEYSSNQISYESHPYFESCMEVYHFCNWYREVRAFCQGREYFRTYEERRIARQRLQGLGC